MLCALHMGHVEVMHVEVDPLALALGSGLEVDLVLGACSVKPQPY